MDKVNQPPLFDTKAAQYVLGCLMQRPSLLVDDDKYTLNTDDFVVKIYKTIFAGIFNLAFEGANIVTPPNLDLQLSSYSMAYEQYLSENGFDLVSLMYEEAAQFDIAQFEIYYNRIKKFSILRELKSQGFDISDIYGGSLFESEEMERKFNKMSVNDIIDHMRKKLTLIETSFGQHDTSSSQSAADGIEDLLDELSMVPEVGLPLEGQIFNYATRGCRKGKMYMYSAPSGGGKTRTMVGNACSIAYPRIENGKVLVPDVLKPVLFIPTEMDASEIQTLILSWISGVNEEKILLHSYTDDEAILIKAAVKIMKKYRNNFIIESVPDPSIKKLKTLISNHVFNHKVEYVFYDYIFTSASLLAEHNASGLREDVVLMMLSNKLKEIAVEFDLFVMTGTQLNGGWEQKTVRNANMLRGSKAIADKIDFGCIGVRVAQDEMQQIEQYIQSMGYQKPNIVIDIYKNRRGKLCDIKIFRYFDYGTCRVKDLFATTQYFEPIDEIIRFEYDIESIDLNKYE